MFALVLLTYPARTRRDAAMMNDAKLQRRASFILSFADLDHPPTINGRTAHEDRGNL